MKSELTLIPLIAIHPDKIVSYSQVIWEPCKPSRKKKDQQIEFYTSPTANFGEKENKANGRISPHAKRKITKALDYLLLMSQPKIGYIPKSGKKFQFQIAFVTLDLPSTQIHSDNEIKRTCWNSFLIELQRYHNVHNYLWRAEKQKNGNIHFHLIIDKFILYSELRKRWNRIANKLGYVDRYRENQLKWHTDGFKVRTDLLKHWPEEKQKQAYLEGMRTNWSSPNSTDIHSVKFISNLKLYVTKYLTKNETDTNKGSQSDVIQIIQTGRIWGCNQELSDIKGAQLEVDSEIDQAMKKVLAIVNPPTYSDTYFSCYDISLKDLKTHSPDVLFIAFSSYMCSHFNFNSQLSI
jgi:hypothetical protein